MKEVIRTALSATGFSLRNVGRGIAGIDLFHDARILLGNEAWRVLFDVGANIGQTTNAMLRAFRSPEIRAFEPSPNTFEVLRRTVGGQRGVVLERLAMGSNEGVMPFHVTRDHSVNDSLLSPTWDAGGEIVEVEVSTIDRFCCRQGIKSIDVLKIDAQGYDLQVLEGVRQMLTDRRIKLYSCEANFNHLYEGQASLRDLLAFADQVGYRLVGFYEQTYVDDRLSYLDALFVAP